MSEFINSEDFITQILDPKIWNLIEKENRSHDVTVLIKGSLE